VDGLCGDGQVNGEGAAFVDLAFDGKIMGTFYIFLYGYFCPENEE
jgi:hypothetical protein